MTYVLSLRTGDFLLHVQVLGKLVPWAFALNHHNYARWLPVHIHDMITLKEKHPTVLQQFLKGHFVVQKSNHRFSRKYFACKSCHGCYAASQTVWNLQTDIISYHHRKSSKSPYLKKTLKTHGKSQKVFSSSSFRENRKNITVLAIFINFAMKLSWRTNAQ